METPRDNNLAMIAAILMLFSTMIDARITIVLSFALLIALIIYQIRENRKQKDRQEDL